MSRSISIGNQLNVVDKRFLSFSIDMSQVVGKRWWNPQGKRVWRLLDNFNSSPFDFKNERVRFFAKELSPAFVKFGGTLADDVFYSVSDFPEKLPPKYSEVLTSDKLNLMSEFAKSCGLDVAFSLNAGFGPRKKGSWTPSNAKELLRAAKEIGFNVGVWLFGNEPNAYVLRKFGFLMTGKKYAGEFGVAREVVTDYFPSSLVGGCSNIFWPIFGEFFPFTGPFLKNNSAKLDVLSWHFYPSQSRRSPVATRRLKPLLFLNPSKLDKTLVWARYVMNLRDKFSPRSALWLSETGMAIAGGERGVSDCFVSSFWWLDHLGLLARMGHSVVIRQTLCGGDYGLIDEASFEPNPDLWCSWLWKRFMGERVFDTSHSNYGSWVRVYAHSTSSLFERFKEGSVSFLLINLSDKTDFVNLGGSFGKGECFEVTGGLFGKDVFVNGVLLKVKGKKMPKLRRKIFDGKRVSLKPRSLVFVVFPEAGA